MKDEETSFLEEETSFLEEVCLEEEKCTGSQKRAWAKGELLFLSFFPPHLKIILMFQL